MLQATVEPQTQINDDPFPERVHPESLPEGEKGLEGRQGQQRNPDGMQRGDLSRHDAIDDRPHEHGKGEIVRTGNAGCCHQQSQLPPVRSSEKEFTAKKAKRFPIQRKVRMGRLKSHLPRSFAKGAERTTGTPAATLAPFDASNLLLRQRSGLRPCGQPVHGCATLVANRPRNH